MTNDSGRKTNRQAGRTERRRWKSLEAKDTRKKETGQSNADDKQTENRNRQGQSGPCEAEGRPTNRQANGI